MLKRSGFPEESELVTCTVTSVQHHSIFVKIDEYGLNGMIHISEVSPGRIRNIRDFVKEGKVVVCKVLKVTQEKGYVDLSLRRVTEMQRRNKLASIKQEQKAEKIIEIAAKSAKMSASELYNKIAEKAVNEYGYEYVHFLFAEAAEGRFDLGKLGLPKELTAELSEMINTRMRPAEVEIKGSLFLKSYAPNGVEIIKNALGKAKDVEITYAGAGKYYMSVKAKDYKAAENIVKAASNSIIEFAAANRCEAEFERE